VRGEETIGKVVGWVPLAGFVLAAGGSLEARLGMVLLIAVALLVQLRPRSM
jgi:hypothetical protein